MFPHNYILFLRYRALRRLGDSACGHVASSTAQTLREAEPLLSWEGQSQLLKVALT